MLFPGGQLLPTLHRTIFLTPRAFQLTRNQICVYSWACKLYLYFSVDHVKGLSISPYARRATEHLKDKELTTTYSAFELKAKNQILTVDRASICKAFPGSVKPCVGCPHVRMVALASC